MQSNETSSSRKQNLPIFYGNRPSYAEHQFMETENNWSFGRSYFGFSRRVPSPETISLERDSNPSVKISMEDDVELNSPSSPVSSLCHDSSDDHAKSDSHADHVVEEEEELNEEDEEEDDDDDDDDDDEIMSSYVIEIGSDHREGTCDAIGIDEAIAWAKEKFQTHSSEKKLNTREEDNKESPKIDAGGRPNVRDFQEQQMQNEKGIVQSPEMEMRLQDKNIRLWSAGKETDIRLLLSTLHYILWPDSGWSAIPQTSIIESTKVKKAYQKARLCLHPDKLQQRGATLAQKYVAAKAFPILQMIKSPTSRFEWWSNLLNGDIDIEESVRYGHGLTSLRPANCKDLGSSSLQSYRYDQCAPSVTTGMEVLTWSEARRNSPLISGSEEDYNDKKNAWSRRPPLTVERRWIQSGKSTFY
ncbi:hypothetical protein TIFTF001_023662 [Ficus carica]|uniref:Uncharacterized protein n=1 Tax=Ficus carica TaxID=3494 RepID=A0AA88DCN0_FICCA|nr:hypothetical protein TIFTF001_023662 [Ficus carica]